MSPDLLTLMIGLPKEAIEVANDVLKRLEGSE